MNCFYVLLSCTEVPRASVHATFSPPSFNKSPLIVALSPQIVALNAKLSLSQHTRSQNIVGIGYRYLLLQAHLWCEAFDSL